MNTPHLNDTEIQNYLDGNCSLSEQKRIKEHLQICADCKELLETYKSIYSVLEEEPSLQIKPDTVDNIMKNINTVPSPSTEIHFKKLWFKAYPIAAVLLLALMLKGIYYFFPESINFYIRSFHRIIDMEILFRILSDYSSHFILGIKILLTLLGTHILDLILSPVFQKHKYRLK